jgi:hypothetical protein
VDSSRAGAAPGGQHMSRSTSVEELLTETLKRAGELAVPEDLLLPLQSDSRLGEIDKGLSVRTGGHAIRSWWIAVGGIAAVVMVAVGLTALLRSSPSVTVLRSQLSAAQGERLLCGAPGCAPVVHSAAGLPSPLSGENASPAAGAFQSIPSQTNPSTATTGTWIVATHGHFVRVIHGSTRAVNSVKPSKPGTVYLSAGSGRYYRFTTPSHGPLRVIGHGVHKVTLRGADSERYVLNLGTAELLPEQ